MTPSTDIQPKALTEDSETTGAILELSGTAMQDTERRFSKLVLYVPIDLS